MTWSDYHWVIGSVSQSYWPLGNTDLTWLQSGKLTSSVSTQELGAFSIRMALTRIATFFWLENPKNFDRELVDPGFHRFCPFVPGGTLEAGFPIT